MAGSEEHRELTRDEFQYFMDMVSQFFVLRPTDERRSFFHPSFRDWLSAGHHDEAQVVSSTIEKLMHWHFREINGTSNLFVASSARKFAVDPKRGHTLLTKVMSRLPRERVTPHAAIEMAHHLLKAKMFRNQSKTTGSLYTHICVIASLQYTPTDCKNNIWLWVKHLKICVQKFSNLGEVSVNDSVSYLF